MFRGVPVFRGAPVFLVLVHAANLQLFARTRFFNIFKFLKLRNRNCASCSLLGNLITRLHPQFLSKLGKNYKSIAFRGRPPATVL